MNIRNRLLLLTGNIIIVGAVCVSCNGAHADQNAVFTACDVTGSVALYDLNKDQWYRTDDVDTQTRTLPASTFKIFHSLIALDMGVTKPDELFQWDGVERAVPVWNQDTRFEDAFKNSTVWVYEELAKRIKVQDYKRYLHWAGYEGNGDIEHGKDGNFWVYGGWGVSPQEQIEMLVKLYQNELPFSRASIEIVKGFMRQGDGVYGKSGWTQYEGQHIGWWIGYKNLSDGPLFFAARLMKSTEKDVGNFGACRKTITDSVIDEFNK